MKALHIQGIGGASGDMILAALLDLGVEADTVSAALRSLPMESIRILSSPAASHGLHGLRIDVQVEGPIEKAPSHHEPHSTHTHAHPHPHEPSHEHAHAHEHAHDHERAHEHEHEHASGHGHRSFREIREILNRGSLSPAVRELSLKVFTRLAEAEGRVHGKPTEEVTFHEVGAVDSIADIVGACFALDALGVSSVSFDPLPLGSGTVHCAHGLYPVPAPAVLELLRGVPTTGGGEVGEMVTPTGAALLTAWRTSDSCPAGRILRSGWGFGKRTWPSRPNALRAILLEPDESESARDEVLCLETHLDDATPEVLGSLVDLLMEAGALDVALTPILMKKQRPGVRLTALCDPSQIEPIRLLIFRETGTFGIREMRIPRSCLTRRTESVDTPYGTVRVKIGSWKGEDLVRKPEFEDCKQRAAEARVPIRAVISAAQHTAPGRGIER